MTNEERIADQDQKMGVALQAKYKADKAEAKVDVAMKAEVKALVKWENANIKAKEALRTVRGAKSRTAWARAALVKARADADAARLEVID